MRRIPLCFCNLFVFSGFFGIPKTSKNTKSTIFICVNLRDPWSKNYMTKIHENYMYMLKTLNNQTFCRHFPSSAVRCRTLPSVPISNVVSLYRERDRQGKTVLDSRNTILIIQEHGNNFLGLRERKINKLVWPTK